MNTKQTLNTDIVTVNVLISDVIMQAERFSSTLSANKLFTSTRCPCIQGSTNTEKIYPSIPNFINWWNLISSHRVSFQVTKMVPYNFALVLNVVGCARKGKLCCMWVTSEPLPSFLLGRFLKIERKSLHYCYVASMRHSQPECHGFHSV